MQIRRHCVPVKIIDQSDLGYSRTKFTWVFLFIEFSFCFLDLYICYREVLVYKHQHYILVKIVHRSDWGEHSYEISLYFLVLYICYRQVFMQKCLHCILVKILDRLNDLDLLAFSYKFFLSFSCLYKEFSFCIMDHYICYVQVLVRKHRHWIHDKILY